MRQTEMSDEDRQKVNKLRELVKDNLTDYYNTDFNLLRWLQGHRELSIQQIADKLNYHLKARLMLITLFFNYCHSTNNNNYIIIITFPNLILPNVTAHGI